jgi:ADP-glucose pyrophosphorylase
MHEPNLMILAAGMSSRMKKAASAALDPALQRDADAKAKAMIGVGPGGRPFLDYLLYNAWLAGYRDIVIVVGDQNDAVRQHYGALDRGNIYHGLTISYAVQRIPAGRTKPLGTADAVLQGLLARPDWAGGQFTVCNSDNLYSVRALTELREAVSPCSVIDYDRNTLAFPADRTEAFAVLQKGADGSLIDIIEKPSAADIARCSGANGRVGVSMNIWRFRSSLILPALEDTPLHPDRSEKELPSAVMLMLRRNPGCLTAFPLAEHVPDMTMRDDLLAVRRYLDEHFGNLRWT